MKKAEFVSRIHTEKPDIRPYRVKIGSLSTFPLVFGCYKDGNYWKVYSTDARGRVEAFHEVPNEDTALDSLYKNIIAKVNQKRRSKVMKSKHWFSRR